MANMQHKGPRIARLELGPLVGRRYTSFRELAHDMDVAAARALREGNDNNADRLAAEAWEDDGGRVS